MQAKKAKQAEIERKRAEVRKRMEEASKAKKAKKGFMTPERKKKLRVSRLIDNQLNSVSNLTSPHTFLSLSLSRTLQLLLRKKAAEELKKEQERKAAERRRIIEERCGSPRNLSDASEGECPQSEQTGYIYIYIYIYLPYITIVWIVADKSKM